MPPLEKKEIESKNVASADIKWRRREGSSLMSFWSSGEPKHYTLKRISKDNVPIKCVKRSEEGI